MNIVISTGAGISAESGIATFRSHGGLWHNHSVDDLATPEGFQRNPELVYQFYNGRVEEMRKAQPNPAHYAISRLQKEWTHGDFTLVTQNVDHLHEAAGSTDVLHIHGDIATSLCVGCGDVQPYPIAELSRDVECHHCSADLRPNVVWFGEMPHHLQRVQDALRQADIFISIGISGEVAPANLFAGEVRRHNGSAITIDVNPMPTHDSSFTRSVTGKAGEVLDGLVDEILQMAIDITT